MISPIKYHNNKIIIIDQRKLPNKRVYETISDIKSLYNAIKNLKIRGAPLIGIAAAYGVCLSSYLNSKKSNDDYKNSILMDIGFLKSSRPTAINLFNILNKAEKIVKTGKLQQEISIDIIKFAKRIHTDDSNMCEKIGFYGDKLIKNDMHILTHCNTGIFATGGIGTALGVIYKSKLSNKNPIVYIGETRPLLQGARLSAYELSQENIVCFIIPDNARTYIFDKYRIDIVIVGADRIAMNGDTANKIGTFDIAINAKYFNVPFYIAAPSTTFDRSIATGMKIPIEMRDDEELYKIGYQGLKNSKVDFINPAFDITPGELINGIITEKGIIYPPYEKNITNFI
jgi:methylthioribose-1-phosphate isomerase